jgi:ribosomal protein L7/L12
MLFAVLEFTDFAIIAGIVALVSGGAGSAFAARATREERGRLYRIEQKVDMILAHMGLQYVPPAQESWQELANDPARKIAAIKAYREQHGVGLKEAKDAVEAYVAGGGRTIL